MKGFFNVSKYEQWIDFNEIMSSNCTCSDFTFRCLKRIEVRGEHPKIQQIKECKHVNEIREKLDKVKEKTTL